MENPYEQKEVEAIIENPHNEEAIDFSVLTANTKLNFNGFDSKVRVDDIQDFLNSIGKFAKLELFTKPSMNTKAPASFNSEVFTFIKDVNDTVKALKGS